MRPRSQCVVRRARGQRPAAAMLRHHDRGQASAAKGDRGGALAELLCRPRAPHRRCPTRCRPAPSGPADRPRRDTVAPSSSGHRQRPGCWRPPSASGARTRPSSQRAAPTPKCDPCTAMRYRTRTRPARTQKRVSSELLRGVTNSGPAMLPLRLQNLSNCDPNGHAGGTH